MHLVNTTSSQKYGDPKLKVSIYGSEMLSLHHRGYTFNSTNQTLIWCKQFRDWIAAFIRSKRDTFEVRFRVCLRTLFSRVF